MCTIRGSDPVKVKPRFGNIISNSHRVVLARKSYAEDGPQAAGRRRYGLYAFALALSLTPPSASSTEYSTLSQPYCLRICSVFFCTKVVKESKLPEMFSPAFFLAATKVLYKRSTCSRSALSTLRRVNGWEDAASAAVAAAAAA